MRRGWDKSAVGGVWGGCVAVSDERLKGRAEGGDEMPYYL